MRITRRPTPAVALALAMAVAVVATACGADAPTPTPPTQPGPTATATRDGLVVTLTLDRAPLTAGVRSWVRVTVANTAGAIRHYQGGGCEFLAAISIETAAPVAPDRGRDWDGAAGALKQLLLPNADPDATGYYIDERFVDQAGGVACPANLGLNEVKPGEVRQMRAAWSGEVQGVVGVAGPARVTASFPYLGLPDGGEMLGRPPQPIQVAVDVDVVDGGVRFLSPGQAIDAALANPGFAAWLAAAPQGSWQGVSLEQRGRSIDVILTATADGGVFSGVATVDRATGAVSFARRNA